MWHQDQRILVTVGGFRAYGLAAEISDLDERGIALPIRELTDDYVGQEAQKMDIVICTLGKACRLVLQANPGIFDCLFCNPDAILVQTVAVVELQALCGTFISTKVYETYTRYALEQLK